MFLRMWAALGAALLLLLTVPAVTAVPVASAATPMNQQCSLSFSLDAVSPTMGQPGTQLWVDANGANCWIGTLAAGQGVHPTAVSMTFNGVSAPLQGSASVGFLYPQVPPGATTGPLALHATWPDGSVSTYTSPTPWVVPAPGLVSATQVSSTGQACTVYAPGRPVVLTGTNFGSIYGPSDAVLVDGQPDPEVTWLSAGSAASGLGFAASPTEQITATLPAQIAPGRHIIAVRTAVGTTEPLTIETGPATSTGCDTTSSKPNTPTTLTHQTQPSTPSTPSTPTTTSTPTTPVTPNTLSITGPETLGGGGRGVYTMAPAQPRATWVSTDPSVATVTDAGVVTAHNAGTATISAISDGQTAEKTVKVTAPTPTTTKLRPTKPTSPSGSFSGPSSTGPSAKGHFNATPTLVGLLVLLLVLLGALLFWLRRKPRPLRREPTSHD